VLRFLGTTLQVATQTACTRYQQPFKKRNKDMKTKLVITMLFLACNLGQSVFSQTMFGDVDCGVWLNKKRMPDRAWVLGYLSGLNTMHELNGNSNNPLSKVNSAEQIYVWMDNYCQKNPLNTVGDGGFQLFIELMKKSK
jgi:hypothetical protein